jgi:type IV pilus assembly protein PilX
MRSMACLTLGCQRGTSLIVSLLMLTVVLMLGISAVQIALQGKKAARNERDWQIGFQAAEAALLDAELDIENSPDAGLSRSALFSADSAAGFPAPDESICHSGSSNTLLGLCRHAAGSAVPAWLAADFGDVDAVTMSTVPYGNFTGHRMQTGEGALPARVPRYIIELMPYREPGNSAGKLDYVYRITAVGFGARDTTQVVLQSFYRKRLTSGRQANIASGREGGPPMNVSVIQQEHRVALPAGRFGWREVVNWQELRNAAYGSE